MTFYEIPFRSLEGRTYSATEYRGKVVLVVNTASACGYTPQYKGLQQLHERLGARGLVVLGVPCNQFGAQEPGSEAQIGEFCEARFGVKFPLLSKAEVKGPTQHPLFKFLLEHLPATTPEKGDVKWNFEKFLISAQGQVLGRFSSAVEPTSPELAAALEVALGDSARLH